MKTNHLSILAVLATLLFAVACGESETDTASTPSAQTGPEGESTAEQPAEPTAEQPAEQPVEQAAGGGEAAAQGDGEGGGVCQRAVTCCEAYVGALGANTPGLSAETTCAGVRQLGAAPGSDQACTSAIAGWRTSLQAAQQTVPASCAE